MGVTKRDTSVLMSKIMAKKNYRVVSLEMLEKIKAVVTDKEHKVQIDNVIDFFKSYGEKFNVIVEIDAKLYSKLWKKIMGSSK